MTQDTKNIESKDYREIFRRVIRGLGGSYSTAEARYLADAFRFSAHYGTRFGAAQTVACLQGVTDAIRLRQADQRAVVGFYR